MFSGPCGDFFWDLHVFVLDPGIVFSTTKLIVSELGFCFWTRAPASWTLPPEGGGELHCYRCSHWAGFFWTLAHSFLAPVRVFLDLAQGGGKLDVVTK